MVLDLSFALRPRHVAPASRRRLLLLPLLLVLVACVASAAAAGRSGAGGGGQNPLRIPMSSLKTLYFKDGAKTYARRGQKLDQLHCIGNSKHLCDTYSPDIIMCKSAGDGAWRCEAELHPSVRLGAVEVSCEGWDHPDDEYVLRGSCILEYNILPAYVSDDRYGGSRSSLSSKIESWLSNLFFLAFFGVLGFMVYSFFRSLGGGRGAGPQAGPRGGGGGGGWGTGGWGPGGGGGGGNDGPPPPYQPYPKGTDPANNTANANWRPGFWTGLGIGGLAAQAARSMFDTSNQRGPTQAANWGAGRRRTFLDDEDDQPTFRRNAGPSSSSQGQTRTSMGFGGTRNR